MKRDGHVHMYVHCENRSLIQSLALMRSAIIIIIAAGVRVEIIAIIVIIIIAAGVRRCTRGNHSLSHGVR